VIHGPKVLFLDEPFEGVDAIAAGTLKAMLQRMIANGATIFLTSHVLEIVERLCSHVGIIHRGSPVAQGSLEDLRAGVEAQAAVVPEAETSERRSQREREVDSRADFSSHRGWTATRRPGTVMVRLTRLR